MGNSDHLGGRNTPRRTKNRARLRSDLVAEELRFDSAGDLDERSILPTVQT
jgi:hypothetical protein